ncbi:MAG: bifunctional diguanylate cyclase/phosphodiesterase [Pseudomonadota bacterium]
MSLTAIHVQARQDARIAAQGQADAIAASAGPALAAGDVERLQAIRRALSPVDTAFTNAQGELLTAPEGFSADQRWVASNVAGADGAIGRVMVEVQRPRLLTPAFWGIMIVGVLATLVGGGIARWFGVRIAQACQQFSDFAEAIGPRRRQMAAVTTFAEFNRMRISLMRAARRFSSEVDRLERVAYTDRVTGLPNRTRLVGVMDEALRRGNGETTAFIYLDLDGYARASESLPESARRSLLTVAANRIVEQIEALSTAHSISADRFLLATLQGDDFGLFMGLGAGREDASALARGLRLAFEKPFKIEGRLLSLGISGGIAIAPDDGETTDDLIRRAEVALSQVRETGRGGFQFYTPRLDRVTQGRYQLETELRAAIEAGAFTPVFQPKISFETGEIVGAEALARWDRGQGRTAAPGAFIPLAEEIGLIDQIGSLILKKACRSAADWVRDGYDVSIAVNVSPCQFERSDFIDQVLDAMRLAGLPPKKLELEITETMAVSNPDRVAEVMRPLRAMGVRLAVDDFGTGHANLSMLTRLPFDVFKIDRQFVSGLEAGAQGPAIVEMILAMAETLGLQTVAEGVETELQADFLRRRGCTLAQGFLYSGGVSEPDFRKLLRDWEAVRGRATTLRAV